jgi:hypothetical protein
MSAKWSRPELIGKNLAATDERARAHPKSEKLDAISFKLVEGFVGALSQAFDLVLDHQFAALQFGDVQVVCGKMHERFVQFVFKALVFAFKFNKMRLYCHAKPP